MISNNFNIAGLTTEQVLISREKYGDNKLEYKKENEFFNALKEFLKNPMILLLLISSSIYFISGKTGDGFFWYLPSLLYQVFHCFKIREAEML